MQTNNFGRASLPGSGKSLQVPGAPIPFGLNAVNNVDSAAQPADLSIPHPADDPSPRIARKSDQELRAMHMAPDNAHLEFRPGSHERHFLETRIRPKDFGFNAMKRTLLAQRKFDALNWSLVHGDARIDFTSADQVENLIDWLATAPPVMYLSLSLFSWAEQQLEELAKQLGKADQLLTLSILLMNLNEACLATLATGLKKHTGLEQLILRNCRIDDAGLAHLADLLACLPKLDTLILSDNNFAGGPGASALFAALSINTSVFCLDFTGNAFHGEALPPLVQMLRTNRNLTMLSLQNNGLDEHDAGLLAEGLMHSTSLKALDISSNSLAAGAIDIVKACQRHPRLMSLTLGSNQLHKVHLEPLSQALAENGTLQVLDIDWHMIPFIENDDFRAFAKELIGNQSLTSLGLFTARQRAFPHGVFSKEAETERDQALEDLHRILSQNALRLPLAKIAAFLDLHVGSDRPAFRDINPVIGSYYRLAAGKQEIHDIDVMMSH